MWDLHTLKSFDLQHQTHAHPLKVICGLYVTVMSKTKVHTAGNVVLLSHWQFFSKRMLAESDPGRGLDNKSRSGRSSLIEAGVSQSNLMFAVRCLWCIGLKLSKN